MPELISLYVCTVRKMGVDTQVSNLKALIGIFFFNRLGNLCRLPIGIWDEWAMKSPARLYPKFCIPQLLGYKP